MVKDVGAGSSVARIPRSDRTGIDDTFDDDPYTKILNVQCSRSRLPLGEPHIV